MTDPIPPSEKPNWLTELQQKSWEPEILLSGIVLYGMFQVPELLEDFEAFAKLNLYDNFNDVGNFVALLKVALYWLIFGLILHLVTRGIWVGMVGLSFAFPNGINRNKLILSPKFQEHVNKIPSIEQIILNLDKLCSSLFSISFMMFMMVIGGYAFILLTAILPISAYLTWVGFDNAGENIETFLGIYTMIILGIAVIGLFDFLTLGLLKRYQWLSKIYLPLHKFISFFTLASFYRPIYLTLITNYNKLKIGLFLFLFVLISFFMLNNISTSTSFPGDTWSRLSIWSNSRGVTSYSGHYDDQNQDVFSVRAHIQSDIISDNTVRLFAVLSIGREESIKEFCDYDSMIKLDTAKSFVNMHCASIFHQVVIDDIKVENIQWQFHYKQKTKQRGLLAYIDITDLPIGMHTLQVKGPDELYSSAFAEIPFYREISWSRLGKKKVIWN